MITIMLQIFLSTLIAVLGLIVLLSIVIFSAAEATINTLLSGLKKLANFLVNAIKRNPKRKSQESRKLPLAPQIPRTEVTTC